MIPIFTLSLALTFANNISTKFANDYIVFSDTIGFGKSYDLRQLQFLKVKHLSYSDDGKTNFKISITLRGNIYIFYDNYLHLAVRR